MPPARSALPDSPTLWITPALASRLAAGNTNAHRLASGAEGWVERLGDDVMISFKNDAALDQMLLGLEQWQQQTHWSPARVFTRFLPHKNADRVCPKLLSGDPTLPTQTVITEGGTQYGVDFVAGYSHGLFLDQRLNREKLRLLKPTRLLNTFAYTCSFSVEGALSGAQTLNIDLSRKSLDRGRHNFSLNGVDASSHRFVAGDVLDWLPQLDGRGERFDAIILDPPTFSTTRHGRRWQMHNDFENLLNAALEVAMPRCAILLSTNCTQFTLESLERRARACAKGKRRIADYAPAPPPEDFPPGHGATTLWMMLRQ